MNNRLKKLRLSAYVILSVLLIGFPIIAHGQTKHTFQDCIKFANEIGETEKICSFATTEGDQPHVRILNMWFADDKGFYFQTESVKALVKQLKENNKVEICFLDQKTGTMMRVTGKVEFLDDLELKSKILSYRPYLKAVGIKGPEDPLLVIFRVYTGEAWFWTRADSMKEAQIERIKF
jgi:pyridoxamine 5'-phosphate oxidase